MVYVSLALVFVLALSVLALVWMITRMTSRVIWIIVEMAIAYLLFFIAKTAFKNIDWSEAYEVVPPNLFTDLITGFFNMEEAFTETFNFLKSENVTQVITEAITEKLQSLMTNLP